MKTAENELRVFAVFIKNHRLFHSETCDRLLVKGLLRKKNRKHGSLVHRAVCIDVAIMIFKDLFYNS